MGKIYSYNHFVTLRDMDSTGNAYFTRILEWQGLCREEFMVQCVKNVTESLSSGISFMTRKIDSEFQNKINLFDHIQIDVQAQEIKMSNATLIFNMIRNEDAGIIGQSHHQIVFLDKTGKIIRIPDNFRDTLIEYSCDKEVIPV